MIRRVLFSLILFSLVFISCSSRVELQWNQEEGYRWAALEPGWGEVGFKGLSSSATGVTFQNRLSKEHIAENQNLLNGSGVAAGDVDGDGLVDLYFAGLDGPNKLYKNLGGLQFKDITKKAGVAHEDFYSTGAVLADVDGDHDLDLLITCISKDNSLYINDGKGNFELKEDSGLGTGKGSMTMALADIDSDSDLDLYIANYKEKQAKDIFELKELALKNIVKKSGDAFVVRPPYNQHFALLQDENGYNQRELGEEDELYINNGKGKFRRVEAAEERFLDAEGSKQGLNLDWGLTAKFADLNEDNLPDLYVCNDYWTPDRVWINQGDGIFRALGKLAIRNFSFYSMAVDFSDINRDGALDFFVTEMLSERHQNRMRQLVPNYPMYRGEAEDQPQYNRNSIYLNRKDTTFAEISYYSGLEASGWSWATKFIDVDLDGYEDLLINSGFSYDMQDLDTQNKLSQQVARSSNAIEGYVLQFPRLELTNKAYRNNRDLTFGDKSSEWGFTEADISHGLATADFDNDGDLDLAINRLNDEARIFENQAGAGRIAVRLKGNQPNTQGVGAKVELISEQLIQTQEINSGGDYLSGSDPLMVFAAKGEDAFYELRVSWPSGTKTSIKKVQANRIYEIEESSSKTVTKPEKVAQNSSVLFKDISDHLGHSHFESTFDDSRIQALLPVKLSQLGPGISWIDFDRDGDEDLFIASGKGSNLGIFENIGDGKFKEIKLSDVAMKASGDQTAIIGWAEGTGTHLFTGSANYEQGATSVPSANHTFIKEAKNNNVNTESIPGILSTTGPLAAADYDSDGDVDLFVGGRFKPANYPQAATSRLFRNDEEVFTLDETNAKILTDLGMVTGAVFTDYDQDGDQDLLLSRSWDSIVLLQNNDDKFENVSQTAGLEKYKGWWNGIATGDFNNDGLPDIVATNWGINSAYQLDTTFPLKMFYGDFDRDNRQEIMEAYYDERSQTYVPRRSLKDLAQPIPPVTRFIQSHTQFANASLEGIFRTNLDNIPSKEINTLKSMLFINTGGTFKSQPLPEEAQFAPAFSAVTADYDNDGNEDIFLSQNLFALPELFPRQDAGRGLWLQGDGNGNLAQVSGTESGIKIYGEQRGAAVADFNKDGRVDLAVSQNGAATKLYVNRTQKPGVNIQLIGPPKNKNAIGSSIRIVYENEQKGPRREIQAGSGYWSQNGFIQVMGLDDANPIAVEVEWFDGTIKMVEITSDKNTYSISY